MSEILIKGMEMPPEGCAYEVRIRGNGAVVDAQTGMKMGTAVELQPHGNLKDEKAIEKTIVEYMGLDSIADLMPAERSIYNCIGYAPTVLEASYRQVKQEVNEVVSKKALLEAFDNYGCPKERNTYLFKALRKLVEDAHEL